MDQKPLVKTILLNWNGGDDTLACLESLSKLKYDRHGVLVVDNGSTDGSPELITAKHPEVELIRAGKNLGFAGGNNVGIEKALSDGADAVFLLNNDTVVSPDIIDRLVEPLFADASLAAVNPKIYYHKEPNRIWSAGGLIDQKSGVAVQLHVDEEDQGQCDAPECIDYAIGCALMTRSDVLAKVGLLDSDFFLYYEETEWCQRARHSGFHIMYVPDAYLWHKVSQSIEPGSPKAMYYYTRNRLLFMRKAGFGSHARAAAYIDLLKMAASYTAKGDRARGGAVLRGIADCISGNLGEAPI